jgi:hypothetical protein
LDSSQDFTILGSIIDNGNLVLVKFKRNILSSDNSQDSDFKIDTPSQWGIAYFGGNEFEVHSDYRHI